MTARLRLATGALMLATMPVFASSGGAFTAAQTVDEVVEKHLAALGGREALTKLTSRRSTGTVTVSTPGGDIPGTFEQVSKAPNKSRVQIALDLSEMGVTEKMLIDQRVDGLTGWTLNSLQGDTEMIGSQLENAKNNVFPTMLLAYKERGARVELLPREQVNGKEALVLLVTPKSGSATRLHIDPASYLVLRSATPVSSPDLGEFDQVTEPSDYRDVNGLKVAHRVVNRSPTQSITIVITSVEHNVPVDDAQFVVKKY